MERKGSRIQVLGVPDVFPADRTADKLLIHFLRPRHGGGEVLRVVYPACRPGQALIMFEEPEVAARVLQQSSHVLEVDNQHFPLRVEAADSPELDLPVEATLHLGKFPDKAEVRRLLSSHGFVTTELHRDQVRVKGSFTKLRAVKARLEELLNSQTQTRIAPRSSSPIPGGHELSSGAVSKNYTNDGSRQDGDRSRFVSQDKPSFASPSSPASSSSRASDSSPGSPESPRRDPHPSPRSGSESFIADADVLNYAQRFRRKDIAVILESHNVKLEVCPAGPELSSVTLVGKSAKIATGKLQSLLNELSKTLRTQEIALVDIDHASQVDLAMRIQRCKDIYGSVLISEADDTVRLVGPSAESYELKQRLLGKPVERPASVRTGRTWGKGSDRRSSSLSNIKPKENTERACDAIAEPPPVGARGYSPSRYQDDKVEQGAGARLKPSRGLRGRSYSESREKVWVEKAEGRGHEKENKRPPPGSMKKLQSLLQIINPKEIKQKLRKSSKK